MHAFEPVVQTYASQLGKSACDIQNACLMLCHSHFRDIDCPFRSFCLRGLLPEWTFMFVVLAIVYALFLADSVHRAHVSTSVIEGLM